MKLPSLPTALQSSSQNGDEDEIILDLKHEEVISKKKDAKGFELNIDIFNELNTWLIMNSPVPLGEKLIFFELLVSVLHAGIPVAEALRLLRKQTKNERMKIAITEMSEYIETGMSLAESMRAQDELFDEATCSIVEAGETSGRLNEVMKELVQQYERMDKIQKKVKAVMTYPVVVIVIMILAAVAVLLFVIPQLMVIFGEDDLPLPTQIMITASEILQHNWHILLVVLIAIAGIFSYWKNTEIGKVQWSNVVLGIPVIGDFVKKSVLSKAMRIFSFLIASGVPIIDALRISSRITGNVIYEKKLLLAADDLTRGIEISENFADDERIFPSMLVSMIAIGEKTASLGSVLEKVADFYDEELERSVGMISKMMEPIIMLVMAIGVVFLIMAIYLPILQMNDKIVG